MARIRKLKLTGLKKVYDTYMIRDFPPVELRPFFSIRRAWARGEYAAYVYEEKGDILAYAALCVCGESFCLLDYFAVVEKYRGQGIGSAFLKALLAVVLPKSELIVEVERVQSTHDAKEADIRQKRLSFYEKNGAVKTGVRTRIFGVNYTILCFPGERKILSEDEYQRVVLEVYRMAYHPFFGQFFGAVQLEEQPP